jgi:predicted signal transduction protein with EAL and GGDEF domain
VPHTISVTMGMAIYPDHASTTAELISAADAAMYRAKASARGTVVALAPAAERATPSFQPSRAS